MNRKEKIAMEFMKSDEDEEVMSDADIFFEKTKNLTASEMVKYLAEMGITVIEEQ